MWKVEVAVLNRWSNAVHLDLKDVPHNYNELGQYTVFNFYCDTPKDTKKVKVVMLDEVCRNQQVNDGCFERLEQVPKNAITLTCPVFIEAPQLFCIVPAKTKAQAVKRTLYGEVNEECPATVLRKHPAAVLYLDADSASLL